MDTHTIWPIKLIMKEVFEECFEKKATSKAEGKPAMAQAWKIILNSLKYYLGVENKR